MDEQRLNKRFANEVVEGFVAPSLEKQRALFYAIQLVNKVHVIMLIEQGVITKEDGAKILKALLDIDKEGRNLPLDPYLGEIYANIERQVMDRIGADTGGRMHTGRSRNDLYACAYRIVVRDKLMAIMKEANRARQALLDRAREHYDTVMPGFTHTQSAQPTTLGHYLLAIEASLAEDIVRIKNAYRRTNVNPLGAAAFAGTSFNINRQRTAELLGFKGIIESSIKSVGDYSYMLEALAGLAICMGNISRFMADVISWSASAFGMIEVDDSFASSSSIMPQKKNPFIAEMVRSAAGELNGTLIKALTINKGIPVNLNFDLICLGGWCLPDFDEVYSCMRILTGMVSGLKVHKEAMARRAADGFSTATELADILVREKGLSFRVAHRVVARAVRMALEERRDTITEEIINQAGEQVLGQPIGLEKEKLSVSVDQVLKARKSAGAGSPSEVQKMVKNEEKSLAKEDTWVAAETNRIEACKVNLDSIIRNYEEQGG